MFIKLNLPRRTITKLQEELYIQEKPNFHIVRRLVPQLFNRDERKARVESGFLKVGFGKRDYVIKIRVSPDKEMVEVFNVYKEM